MFQTPTMTTHQNIPFAQCNKLESSFTNLQNALSTKRNKAKTSSQSYISLETGSLGDSVLEQDKDKNSRDGAFILSDFMSSAGEPITYIEAIELWCDMRATNNSKFPRLDESLHSLSQQHSGHKSLFLSVKSLNLEAEFGDLPCVIEENKDFAKNICFSGNKPPSNAGTNASCDHEGEAQDSISEEQDISVSEDIKLVTRFENDEEDNRIFILPTEAIIKVARGIKEVYGIRLSDDKSELRFITGALLLLWITVLVLAVVGHFYPSKSIGSLKWEVLVEALTLFVAELAWECILSALVLKYNIKINYTRKLGNLLKIPKYFAADLFPFYESTATSLVTALAINQTLFCLMYYRKSREKIPFFSYVFLSQDRREDRPDTLIFQVTEDIVRFGIYFPFKILVANRIGAPEIIFIPIAVNNIGDGLAEPVGVAFGRHKYTTTALYHKGQFFKSKFTRSYEGSSCVFITTLIVVAINYKAFSTNQFWITIAILPFLMTIAEAKAPHTNDGPFLALVGCSFLSAIFLS